MGKVRGKKDLKKSPGSSKLRGVEKDNNTLGKISAEIGAISLGPPRTKILKKTGGASSSSSNFSANFASRINHPQNKQKKKVTFCQNLIAEELKERSAEGEDAKNYFKVVHPSAIDKRRREGKKFESIASRVASAIPGNDVLLSGNSLRKIIKKSVKSKKIRLSARKDAFRKKMELIKANNEELKKAKQRQKIVIVGDMHPMLESLPSVETNDADNDKLRTELASKLKEEEMKIPKKTKFSVKKTQKAILDSLKFFEAAGVGKTAAGLSAN